MYYVCNIRIKREILEIITNEKGEKRNMNKVGVVSLVAVRERERERELYFNEINNNKININNKIAINLKMEKFRFYIVIFFWCF